jgi:hypothetical protein
MVDLGLHVLNRVVAVDPESDGHVSQSLHEDWHKTTQTITSSRVKYRGTKNKCKTDPDHARMVASTD